MNKVSSKRSPAGNVEYRTSIPFFVSLGTSLLVVIVCAVVLLLYRYIPIYVIVATSAFGLIIISPPVCLIAYKVGAVLPVVSKGVRILIWTLLAMLLLFYPALVHFALFTPWLFTN